MNARLPHLLTPTIEDWASKFAASGFTVEREIGYFTPIVGGLWSVLFLQAFRVFGVLKLIPRIRARASRAAERLFAPVVHREMEALEHGESKVGYVLLYARKEPGPGSA
jgi:hypothetical protein